jgi:hypothetical protein
MKDKNSANAEALKEKQEIENRKKGNFFLMENFAKLKCFLDDSAILFSALIKSRITVGHESGSRQMTCQVRI